MSKGITIRRVVITAVREGDIKRFDADGLVADEFPDREFFQQDGFTSRPKAGAEGIVIGIGNVFYLIASDDRTSRPALQNDGDVAIYSADDNYVLIKDSGDIEIHSPGDVNVTCDGKVNITGSDDITVKSDTKVIVDAPEIDLGKNATGMVVTTQCACSFTGGGHPQGSTKTKSLI